MGQPLVTKLQRLAREALAPKPPGPKPAAAVGKTAAPPSLAMPGLSLGDDHGRALLCTLAVHMNMTSLVEGVVFTIGDGLTVTGAVPHRS